MSEVLRRVRRTVRTRLGWGIERVDDHAVHVRAEGVAMCLVVNPADPSFLRAHVDVQRPPDLGALTVLEAADAVSAHVIGAQVVVSDASLRIVSELLVAAPESLPTRRQLAAVLPQVRDALRGAVQRLDEEFVLAGIREASSASGLS